MAGGHLSSPFSQFLETSCQREREGAKSYDIISGKYDGVLANSVPVIFVHFLLCGPKFFPG